MYYTGTSCSQGVADFIQCVCVFVCLSVCLSVCVSACVPVCYRFSDRLQIDVVDGVSHAVDVTGCGQGIAVITLPTLPRRLRLGPCYCGHVARHEFTIVNKGRRQQTVFAVNAAAAVRKSSRHPVRVLHLRVLLLVSTGLFRILHNRNLFNTLEEISCIKKPL